MANKSVFCIVRYGEIALKGNNRQMFEKELAHNLKRCLKLNNLTYNAVLRLNGRFLVDLGCVEPETYKIIGNVFGISSISFAYEFSHDELEEGIDFLLKERKFSSFRITTRKVHHAVEKKSSDFDKELGGYVATKYNKKVLLEEYDLNINIELIRDKAYMFLDKIKAIGGLPYGIEGKTLAVISGDDSSKGKDKERRDRDKLAAILMMKRGCSLVCIGKPIDFTKFGVRPRSVEVNIGNIQDINEVAEKEGCKSVVLGQTLSDFEKVSSLVEFRPLIGMSDEEISAAVERYCG